MNNKDEEWRAIGERLKEARVYRGYSQEEIAEYLGISRSSVSLIENGARKVDSIELRKLAKLYDTTTDHLIGELGEPVGEEAEIQMVARAAKGLSAEDREEVLRFAEFLRSKRTEGEEDGSSG